MRPTAINWAHYADCNVCVVDWSRLANYDYSVAAMQHTKMVTEALAHFIDHFIANGMNVSQVSIAGHSLGAQIAGFIGQKFFGSLDSIYGIYIYYCTIYIIIVIIKIRNFSNHRTRPCRSWFHMPFRFWAEYETR